MNPWGYVVAAVIGGLVVLYTNRTRQHDTLKTLVEIHKDMPASEERRALATVIRSEVRRLTEPKVARWWQRAGRWALGRSGPKVELPEVATADDVVEAIERADSLLSLELRRSGQIASLARWLSLSAVLMGLILTFFVR
ncbi:hypothetical protein QNA19_08765 [Rhodococcus fascians]|uniref:hypothetical protein n=1 Tax=Rhodococcoides fascians TaxID=1828 RepID=UPI0024BB99FE|nr:hypothetical protein [Rhodococcus fascians]MDJ0426007.1 hypothetical protein [Rhodococcus fascians]